MPRYYIPPLLTVLGAVTQTLSKIPEPISATILSLLDDILKVIEQTNDNKNQLGLLFVRICDILQSLQVPQSLTGDDSLRKSSDQLIQNLENIRDFAISTKGKNFFKAMIQADDIRFKIEELERRLWSSCLAFQNSALITANRKLDDLWLLASNSDKNRMNAEHLHQAQLQDQTEQLKRIQSVLDSLESKTAPDHRPLDTLLETLNVNPVVTMTGMSALLERHELGRIELREEEVKFLKAGVKRLKQQSSAASAAKIKAWTVTSFEVEKGFLIGWDTTSYVRTAKWLGKRVGLVEVVDENTVQYFVKLWKNLRSTRTQGLLGASTVDDPPFLVIPHPNINVIEHIRSRPINTRFIRIFLEIARALEYLHSRDPPVVHGGICSSTLTIDEDDNISLSCIGLRPEHLNISSEEREKLHHDLARWYAPEVRNQPNKIFTEASDVFALGVVFSDILAVIAELKPPIGMLKQNRELVKELVGECSLEDPLERPTMSQVAERLQTRVSNVPHADLMATAPSSKDVLADGTNTDRWRVAYFTQRRPVLADEDDHDLRYVSSTPIEGSTEHPLRQLCIEVECHDQGRERTTARQQDGAWAWVELSLHRMDVDGKRYQVNLAEELAGHPRGFMVDDTRYEIVRCPFADDTKRVHRITLDHRNPFVKAARKGDQVVLNPRARFAGWFIIIYSAEMQVVTE